MPSSKCIDVYEKNGKLSNTIDCAELELLSYPVRVAFSSAEVVFLGKGNANAGHGLAFE